MAKKQDNDKISITKLKHSDLISLWLTWQCRPDSAASICATTVVEDSSAVVPDQDHSQQINIDCDPDMVDDHGTIAMIQYKQQFVNDGNYESNNDKK